MGLTLLSGPATEPVTLQEAKAHCSVSIPNDDGLIAGYILAARVHLETLSRRAFITQTYSATFDYRWPFVWDRSRLMHRNQVPLPRPPLQSVSSITYVDSEGASQTLAESAYNVSSSGIEGIIEPSFGSVWPTVREQTDAITVQFACGYGPNAGSVPDPIRQAMLMLIGHWYENREAVNVGNIVTPVPFAIDALIGPYRVFY